MDWHTWLAFFVASWIIAVSPGSGAVLSMSHGLSYGVRKTSATILGLQLGLLLILLIAGAGVGSLLMASEWAFNAVKIAGACYLIYLGISQWRAGGSSLIAQEVVPEISFRRRVLTGFLTNATNPKGIIFMVAVLPQFMTSSRPLAPQLAILAVTMLAVDTTVMHGYAAGASALRGLMRSARAMRNQNRVFGSLLMAVGSGLFFVQRAASS
ncbi:LysE family transporter [Comamonas sp. w2-DMI]|uniref:LysE family transporter n=1 Tax=Comamonas terrae TaxID=673548 RepID=A0ABW5ULN0_9BURK|nr:LysE family transporter [Comamonas terrae]